LRSSGLFCWVRSDTANNNKSLEQFQTPASILAGVCVVRITAMAADS
jgi:hypothetical protein